MMNEWPEHQLRQKVHSLSRMGLMQGKGGVGGHFQRGASLK